MVTVLIAEDDVAVRLLTKTKLSHAYRILEAGDGEEALEILDHNEIDLLIVDIQMPKMDGYELVRALRDAGDKRPVIMLTAMSSFEHKKEGFASGIDDYMTKPIDYEELIWRIEALLRRANIASEKKITVGKFIMDQNRYSAEYDGMAIELTGKEFDLLFRLLSYPGTVFTKQQLMDSVWGFDTETEYDTIKTYISKLRNKCCGCDEFELVSIRGLGYKAVIRSKEKKDEKNTVNSRFPLIKFKWVLLLNVITIFLTTLSSVLIHLYDFNPEGEHIRLFLQINTPLVAISSLIYCILLIIFRQRIDQLFRTLQAVADGNLVIAVDTKRNDEYGTAYQNLSRVVRELKGSKREMQQFTNDFLHEFRTPITAIQGFAEYLISTGDGIETPERMKYLQIIADESVRLSDLSQKNLLLAKVDACEIITNKTEFDLGEQIKNCTILILPQIEEKQIELELDVEELTYCGDAELMEQVWLNLIGNAVKFTPEHGEITIRGRTDEEGVTVSVSDSGSGMDEETLKHIFEKYYQGQNGRQKGGNGIGLSIVHRIVTLCGGTVTVESKESVGSRFTVRLP